MEGIFFLLEKPNLFAICNNTFSKWWEGWRMACRRVLSSTPLWGKPLEWPHVTGYTYQLIGTIHRQRGQSHQPTFNFFQNRESRLKTGNVDSTQFRELCRCIRGYSAYSKETGQISYYISVFSIRSEEVGSRQENYILMRSHVNIKIPKKGNQGPT
jgi:hypothetical protein